MESDEFYELQLDMKRFKIYYDKKNQGFKVHNLDLIKLLHFKGFRFSNYSDFVTDKKQLIESETDYFRRETFDENLVKGKLYKYQLEDVNWLVKKSRNFLANEPQTGKTIETISWISHLRKKEKINGVFIVVKNGLEYHWIKEILEHSKLFVESEIKIIDNKNKKDFLNIEQIPYVIITPNHSPVFSTFIEENKKNIYKLENYCLIIDEVHEFSNIDAKRTQSLESIIDLFKFRIFLSATPAMNSYVKWFTLMRLLDKGIIQHDSLLGFSLDVGKFIGDKFNPFKVLTYNEERVKYYNQLFRGWVIKRKKSELEEMKTKQFSKPIWFEMSEKHKQIINLVKVLELEKVDLKTLTYSTIQNNFPYLCLAVDNPEMLKTKIKEKDKDLFQPLKKLLDSWKIENHQKVIYLDSYLKEKIKENQEKIIVYDTHPVTLNQLYERYQEYNPLIIHGELGLTKEEKQKTIDLFNDKNSKYKLIILNVMSAGTGTPFYKSGCKNIVFFSLSFDSTLTRQALDRVYGINSTEDSNVEILTFDKSIDSMRLKKTLERIDQNDNQFVNKIEYDKINLDELLKI